VTKKTLIILILACLVLSTVLVAATGCGNHKPGATDYETSEPAGEDNVKPDEGPGDTTPPTCSNILVTQITPKSATISWQTDEPANTCIEYGTTTDYGTLSSLQTDLVTDHCVTLDDLTSGTCYHFRARSIDAAWNTGLSDDFTFTTVDTAKPIITRIDLFSVKQTSAVIVWVTDEPTTGSVEYGTTSDYGLTAEAQDSLRPNHTVTLNDLIAETTYHFRIRTTDATGNQRISPDESFTTWLSQSRLQGKILFCEAPLESDAYLVPYELYLIDANTNVKEKLVDFQLPWYMEDMDTAVAVSPDKSSIAYFTSSASAEGVTGSLHLLSLGTGQDVQLATYSLKTEADLDTTKAQAGYRVFEKIYISWSPDGSKLAYVINRNLYVIGADGTGGTMLHETPWSERQWYTLYGWQQDQIRRPIWSSDGTHVIFDEFTRPTVHKTIAPFGAQLNFPRDVGLGGSDDGQGLGRCGDRALPWPPLAAR
jgi:hypothetical protein